MLEDADGKMRPSILQMHMFFGQLKADGSGFVTRLIRQMTGTTKRDNNLDTVVLPTHLRRRRCYARWCCEQGWKVVYKSQSTDTYAKPEVFQKRPNDDALEVPLWPTVSVKKEVVSRMSFNTFWHKNYSGIKVRSKSADVCTGFFETALQSE